MHNPGNISRTKVVSVGSEVINPQGYRFFHLPVTINRIWCFKRRLHGLSPVTTEQALEIKEKIGVWSYVECSSRTKENLEYLFDEVVQFAVLNTPIKPIRKKRCVIM